MNFTISTLAQSLADYLAPLLPESVTFLEDPSQQSEEDMPCMFLQTRSGNVERRIHLGGGFWERRIGLDLVYLDRYNLPDLQQRYSAVAEILDGVLDRIPYADTPPTEQAPKPPTVPLHTYERSYSINEDALHYKFDLRLRVAYPEIGTKMQTLTQNISIQEAQKNG